jgi:hypothetical protein
VFVRAIPFEHLGREKDARVFIARTLEPGEAVASAVVTASKQLKKQKAAATVLIAGPPKQLKKQTAAATMQMAPLTEVCQGRV